MPLDPFDAHVIAEFPQALTDVRAERAKDCFLPLLRYDDDVVSAIPPDMALVVPFSHCGFSLVWPWRVHNGRNHIPLHESTPERQSLFESHRQRRWLTHWSHQLRSTNKRQYPFRYTTDNGFGLPPATVMAGGLPLGDPAPPCSVRERDATSQQVVAWPSRWRRRYATRHDGWGGAHRSMPVAPAGTS